MCALFGWLDYKGIISNKIRRKLTQALANASEERGTDASGISYVKKGHITIYKRPKPAHKLKFNILYGTKAVMGHTRLTTQGNEKYNYNNHPFRGYTDKEFAFAHNGVLFNDDILRWEKQLPETYIETDNYVAVQLIEQQGKLNFDSLKSMSEDVQGNFTFTALDEDNTLYIVKGNNPLYFLHFPALGMYIYASTESIMRNALRQVGMNKSEFEVIKTFEGDITQITCNGEITRSGFECFPDSRYTNRYYDYSEYYTEHEQILLDMRDCFGVSEEEIMLMLDYGYTADDIEGILMCPDMIEEIIYEIKSEEEENYYSEICKEVI